MLLYCFSCRTIGGDIGKDFEAFVLFFFCEGTFCLEPQLCIFGPYP